MPGIDSVVLTALPKIIQAQVSEDSLTVDLDDGRTITVPIGWYPRLAYGTDAERQHLHIAGAGFGLHWPDLDEDIGVEGLLLGKKSTETAHSLAQWLTQRSAH